MRDFIEQLEQQHNVYIHQADDGSLLYNHNNAATYGWLPVITKPGIVEDILQYDD